MLHVLFLTVSSHLRDEIAQLLPSSVCLTVISPSAALPLESGTDVCLFDLNLGLPVLGRWAQQATCRLPVVALSRTGRAQERRQALKKGVSDVLNWKNLDCTSLLRTLQKATRPEAPRILEHRLYEPLFRQSRFIQWLVEPGSGRIVDANRTAARFYEYEPDHLAQLHIDDINELSAQVIAQKMMQAVREKQNHFTFFHRTATGKRKNVQIWSYPVRTACGTLLFSTICPLEPEAADRKEVLRTLSPREQEIFHLLAEGKTITQIKADLHLARGTVKNHLSRIYRKLGVSGRAEALYWAAKRGLLS